MAKQSQMMKMSFKPMIVTYAILLVLLDGSISCF